MAKINNELLKHEMLQYQDLKKLSSSLPIPSFGKYMNNKYYFKDDELSEELEFEKAYLIIKTKHVKI